jgi:hypothetical protein
MGGTDEINILYLMMFTRAQLQMPGGQVGVELRGLTRADGVQFKEPRVDGDELDAGSCTVGGTVQAG